VIQEAIRTLTDGGTLAGHAAEGVMGEIMDGKATPSQIAGLAVAVRMAGETVDGVAGFARAMRLRMVRVKPRAALVADTCGTGGGTGLHTVNVSTGAALAAAGAGVVVAKHGNRAMSSRSGSADVFAALGVRVDAPPPLVERCLNEVGIAFCFAQVFHPAMKHAGPTRRELGIRTVFNLLGPLTNPAGAQVQLIGVARRDLLELEARSLAKLGTRRSLVVHSRDGLDEVSIGAPTEAIEVAGRTVKRRFTLTPAALGLKRGRLSDLAGGAPEDNAAALMKVLRGARGAHRDAIVANAGIVCWLAGRERTPRAGVALAAAAIDSGAALEKLEALKRMSQSAFAEAAVA
jgi:anthranilate phosphoribosyltransferase